MARFIGRLVVVMVALGAFAPMPLRANPADTLLVNGRIVTLDEASSIHAGEAVSERDELDVGPSFFGEAKEAGSLRPMQSVQVSAELGARRMSTYSNDEGSFKIPSFGRDTVVDNVTIACTKEGYRALDISRRRLSGAADAPVVIECLLERAP